MDMRATPEAFVKWTKTNPVNAAILEQLPCMGLSQCFLTAGCLFQTVWNQRSDRPLQASIKDYDVFYFNDGDLSCEAEVLRFVFDRERFGLPDPIDGHKQRIDLLDFVTDLASEAGGITLIDALGGKDRYLRIDRAECADRVFEPQFAAFD